MKSVNASCALFSFSWRRSVLSLTALLPIELDLADLDLRALVHVEGQVNQLRAAGNILDFVRDVGELEALLAQHVAHDPLDLAHEARVDEGVEADLGVRVLQLLVDLRGFDLLRADVVDDLDALPLLHVVGDDLADRPVGELVVADVDPEVVEEIGVPQPVEVVQDGLLARVVVVDPLVLRRGAELLLDVIQVGLRVDDRGVSLRLEARGDEEDHGRVPGGRLGARGNLLAADVSRRQGRGRLLWAAAGAAALERQGRHGKRTQRNTHFGYFRLRIGPSGRQASFRPASSSPAGRYDELAGVQVDLDLAASQMAADELLRERIFDIPLNRAPQRARTVRAVLARDFDDPVDHLRS